MRHDRPYTFGFWMMVVIVVFRVFLLVSVVLVMLRSRSSYTSSTFFPILLAMILGLTGEAMFYWYRRYKIPNKTLVHFHIWPTFLAMVVIPIVTYFMMPALIRRYYEQQPPETEYYKESVGDILTRFTTIQQYMFWGLLAIGHIFFIATIVKSFQLKDEEPNESAGLLDEFIDRR